MITSERVHFTFSQSPVNVCSFFPDKIQGASPPVNLIQTIESWYFIPLFVSATGGGGLPRQNCHGYLFLVGTIASMLYYRCMVAALLPWHYFSSRMIKCSLALITNGTYLQTLYSAVNRYLEN